MKKRIKMRKSEILRGMISLAGIFFIFSLLPFGCAPKDTNEELVSYFEEIKVATKEHAFLWDKDLYAPILLVNPNTEEMFANEPDDEGVLKKKNDIYTGKLPDDLGIGNTAVYWNGKHWAMILLPLPKDKQERISLMAHELFHVMQPKLGFKMNDRMNNHLDQKEGRIYLRLELEALRATLLSSSKEEEKQHLTDAFIFRKYRNLFYEGSDTLENLLELKEGLAEYTGFMHAGYAESEAETHFINSMSGFLHYPTFVRSFAYQTTPVYGYLLQKDQKNWNRNIVSTTNLTAYFIDAFEIILPEDIQNVAEYNMEKYNGRLIIEEETLREEENRRLIVEYKAKFIENPHLEIPFEQMQISFDPRNIMSIEDEGTVYPNVKIIDLWGTLTVENGGALITPSWNKISVSAPIHIEEEIITGDGWTLELAKSHSLVKEEETGNYTLLKNR